MDDSDSNDPEEGQSDRLYTYIASAYMYEMETLPDRLYTYNARAYMYKMETLPFCS